MARIEAYDLAMFLGQLSRLLAGDLSPINSLEILSEHIEKRQLKKTVDEMIAEMKRGESFYRSAYITKSFDPCFLRCLKEADENNRLMECIKSFEEVYGEEDKREKLVKGTVYLPLLITGIAAFLLILLVIFIYPHFITMFEDINIQMPGITSYMLKISFFLRDYWALLLLLIIVIILTGNIISNSSLGRKVISRFIMESGLFCDVRRKLIFSKFSRFLRMLRDEGVPDKEALSVLAATFDRDLYFSERLYEASEKFDENHRLSQSLEKTGMFPAIFIEMMGIGEELGDVNGYLDQNALFYLSDAERMAEKRYSIWEPLVFFFLIFFLIIIIISLTAPMLRLYDGVSGI